MAPMLVNVLALACLFVSSFSQSEGEKISAEKSLVFGPGLEAEFALPVRYFYIQAVGTDGLNFTESPGEDTFQVNLKVPHGRTRIWWQVLDRHDGSFLVRYRPFASYDELKIEITLDGKNVAKSPYILRGGLYHENCYCPEEDGSVWEKQLGCPSNYTQIDVDLSVFPEINLDILSKDAVKRFGKHHSLCHYTIIKNKIYRKTHGQYVGFSMFTDAILLSMARKVRLPDMEFFVNLGDWPLVQRHELPIPILSWCGSEDTYDVIMPTYDITEATLETLGRVTLDIMSVQANTGPKWKDKIPKALWRGRDSRQERLDLVVMGRKKPELYDVALTNFFFFPYDESKYGPKEQRIPFFDFFKHKYQINIDGTVAAYRFPFLIAGDSVVLKQDSPYYEHFYKDLTPWVHYIPFKRDLSDLEEKILWAKEHDEQAQEISKQGQQFARENLMPRDIYCYHWVLFKEYARRQTTKPKKRKGMERVQQPSNHDSKCHCYRNTAQDHDEL